LINDLDNPSEEKLNSREKEDVVGEIACVEEKDKTP